MTRGVFVTGTDTGVGKTVMATALLSALVRAGRRAAGMKPVASGIAAGEAVNADVAALMAAGNVDAALGDVNPYAFPRPIAPHLAAAATGVAIDPDRVAAAFARLARVSDVVVVEGAGGVLVPLSRAADMLDLPRRLDLPVLLVVGIRLGCLNHALLSALAVNARGLRLAGWVANRIDGSMAEGDANVASLVERLPAPLVADLAWARDGAPSPTLSRESLEKLGLAG